MMKCLINERHMDKEIENLKLNINQLAAITDLHRQTISNRLRSLEPAEGSNAKLKLYTLTDILTELFTRANDPQSTEVDSFSPQDRKAWFQSENERLRFEKEAGQLLPAAEVARQFAEMAKAVVQVLETLPDILERDCGLQAASVEMVQNKIDDLRNVIASRVMEARVPEEEGEAGVEA
jgi:hypothetical protein